MLLPNATRKEEEREEGERIEEKGRDTERKKEVYYHLMVEKAFEDWAYSSVVKCVQGKGPANKRNFIIGISVDQLR